MPMFSFGHLSFNYYVAVTVILFLSSVQSFERSSWRHSIYWWRYWQSALSVILSVALSFSRVMLHILSFLISMSTDGMTYLLKHVQKKRWNIQDVISIGISNLFPALRALTLWKRRDNFLRGLLLEDNFILLYLSKWGY